MRLTSLEDYPLLVTEPSWNTKENREKMVELAFEQWNAPAYYSVDRAVMSALVLASFTLVVTLLRGVLAEEKVVLTLALMEQLRVWQRLSNGNRCW